MTDVKLIDSFPDIKATLMIGCKDSHDFMRELLKRGAPKDKEEFNIFMCNLLVMDDVFALLALANKWADKLHTTRADILNPIFDELHRDYIEATTKPLYVYNL